MISNNTFNLEGGWENARYCQRHFLDGAHEFTSITPPLFTDFLCVMLTTPDLATLRHGHKGGCTSC